MGSLLLGNIIVIGVPALRCQFVVRNRRVEWIRGAYIRPNGRTIRILRFRTIITLTPIMRLFGFTFAWATHIERKVLCKGKLKVVKAERWKKFKLKMICEKEDCNCSSVMRNEKQYLSSTSDDYSPRAEYKEVKIRQFR